MYHASIIKLAIKHKVNVATTCYVSDAIRELDGPAKKAGIVVLNEVGADPGVDHLYATKKIEEVHFAGGKVSSFEPLTSILHRAQSDFSLRMFQVKEFYSYCGGLAAREC